jgi:hypothetical protein
VLLWYGAGVHVIEGAFQEHTEPCLIARCYRDALPMLLGVECGSTSGAEPRPVSPREVRAAAWQSRVRRRYEGGRSDTRVIQCVQVTAVGAGAGAMGNGNGDDRLARQETSRDGARGRGDGGAAGFDERPGHLQRCVRLRVGSRRRALVVCGILDVWLQDARRCDSPQLAVRGLLEGAAHAAASVGWSLSTGKPLAWGSR